MVFNSFNFIVFIGIMFLLYSFCKGEYRWILLLTASVAFYLFSGVKEFVFLLATSFITFVSGVYIDKNRETKINASRMVLIGTLLIDFGLLFWVKYYNFFLESITGKSVAKSLILPLGISFYTFSLTGYLPDVYWGVTKAEKKFGRLLLFSSYFPTIITGPINTYDNLKKTLFNPKDIEYARCKKACLLFAWGLFKKICVADNIKVYVDLIYSNSSDYHGIMILSAGIAYSIYLYADFSGCIDMAKGISKFMGIEIAENFNLPYFAYSVEDFWRRWHISLNEWFRKYLFYPLLKSNLITKLAERLKKRSKKLAKAIPTCIALLVVWFTTGLWHGANYTFILWGLYYGIIFCVNTLFKAFKKSKKESRGSIIITYLLVCLGFIVFNAKDVNTAINMYANLIDIKHFIESAAIVTAGISFYKGVGGSLYFVITVCSVIILFANELLLYLGKGNLLSVLRIHKTPRCVKYVLSVLTVVLLCFMMNRSAGDFTYMRF